MLFSYLRSAWRNMARNKFFSIVNIFGLSAGLACCMLIALYLHYEMSYDHYHAHAGDLYQVATTMGRKGEKGQNNPMTPAPMARALKAEFPEVLESTRLMMLSMEDKTLVQYTPAGGEKRSFLENRFGLTDGAFFRVFTYDFSEGSPAHALDNPFTTVISEEIAHKLFGNEPALNKVIHINSNTNGEYDYTVTGVFRRGSHPTSLDIHFFANFEGGKMADYINGRPNNFAINNMFYTFLRLKPGDDPAQFEARLPAFMHKYADGDLKARGMDKKQFLIPVKELHLSDLVKGNITAPASRTYLYILASIAVFILLIACINFMNLSTARSSKRSAEVGVRKVLGAERSRLIRQFLGESLLMTALAFILALGLAWLLLPLFDQVSGRTIEWSWSADKWLFGAFGGMALLTGLIAGSYPALYLSSFNPIQVLKGRLVNSLAVAGIRRGLVVFQFMISITLIISTVVILRQMNFLRTADLGFAKDQQIVIPLRGPGAKAMYSALKDGLRVNHQVISVGGSTYYPGIFTAMDNPLTRAGQTMSEATLAQTNPIDADFLKTLDLKLAAGRLYSSQFPADTNNTFILNETAVKALGFPTPQSVIGQTVYIGSTSDNGTPMKVVGVVRDFHFDDLHVAVKPYSFTLAPRTGDLDYLVAHVQAGGVAAAIQTAKDIWKKYDSNDPFEYTFLDDQFQHNYEADNRLAGIVGYFTVIAILISCLGLFGLAAFSAEQRTKEIGVRKVLGASVTRIVTLLSVEFLRLIGLSLLIASPLAWWVMSKWLQGFAYRQPITAAVFVYTAVIAGTIGLLTIGFQALRAATANPVKALRSE